MNSGSAEPTTKSRKQVDRAVSNWTVLKIGESEPLLQKQTKKGF